MAVVNVKRSTQTFSKAEQTSSKRSDSAGVNTNAAQEFQKAFGDQELGDVLNKVSDPNWVDPSKKMRTAGNNALDKDAFLKLMLAQMKNQDPTSPMQSHEMAAQLAQFTSLEQLNNINTTLEGMKEAQAPSGNFQALAFIGKKVSGDSTKLTRAAGDTKHTFNFNLLNDAAKVKINVKDAAGTVVRTIDYAQGMKKGENSIEWNGLNNEGMPQRAGEYKFSVEAVGSNGSKVYAKTAFEGRITGLSYGSDGPVLMVGDQTIKMSDVKKIEDVTPADVMHGMMPATPLRAGENGKPAVKPQLPNADLSKSPIAAAKAQAEAEEEEIPPAEDVDVAAYGNIADVPMSREMMNRLEKETN